MDINELKEMLEAKKAAGWTRVDSLSIDQVLELIAENDRLSLHSHCHLQRAQNVELELDRLKAENEVLRKDAGRYQWLRDKQTFIWLIQDWFPSEATFTDVDAEIDTAMAKEAGQ